MLRWCAVLKSFKQKETVVSVPTCFGLSILLGIEEFIIKNPENPFTTYKITDESQKPSLLFLQVGSQ